MAKPPTSYGASVKLKATEPANTLPIGDPNGTEGSNSQDILGRRRPMESKSDPTLIYLHPDGKYELKRYALAKGPKVKVHDLLIEAVEEWAKAHGIVAPFRVPSMRTKK